MKKYNYLAKKIKKLKNCIFEGPKKRISTERKIYNLQIQSEIVRRQYSHPNIFCRYGRFGFSQTDEDGITLEVISRLGLLSGTFCEFGVGDGSENNTLILLASGWQGYWFGNEDIVIDTSCSKRLNYYKRWITKDNIYQLYLNATKNSRPVDIISFDLDGNDFHLLKELLINHVTPKLFIVEYNAKFPPPVKFEMPYSKNYKWIGGDFFGASLTSFVELFHSYEYSLICCNAASGANAFFIQNKFRTKFSDVPNKIQDIYTDPFYYIPPKGHFTSISTLQNIIT